MLTMNVVAPLREFGTALAVGVGGARRGRAEVVVDVVVDEPPLAAPPARSSAASVIHGPTLGPGHLTAGRGSGVDVAEEVVWVVRKV